MCEKAGPSDTSTVKLFFNIQNNVQTLFPPFEVIKTKSNFVKHNLKKTILDKA